MVILSVLAEGTAERVRDDFGLKICAEDWGRLLESRRNLQDWENRFGSSQLRFGRRMITRRRARRNRIRVCFWAEVRFGSWERRFIDWHGRDRGKQRGFFVTLRGSG